MPAYGDVGGQLFDAGKLRTDVDCVRVKLDGTDELVWIDPVKGPRINHLSGNTVHFEQPQNFITNPGKNPMGAGGPSGYPRSFKDLTATEAEIMVITAAKKNRKLRERYGSGHT